jgi:hypothetical protein
MGQSELWRRIGRSTCGSPSSRPNMGRRW